MMLRSCAVLSKHCIASQRLTNAQPALEIVRYVRTRSHNDDPKGKKSDEKSDSANDSKKSDWSAQFDPKEFTKKNPDAKFEYKKVVVMNPVVLKRMLTIGAISFGISAVLAYFTMKLASVQTHKLAGEEVEFDQFVEKFLKAGEVRSIAYFPQNKVALAELHKDAIIDGKPFGHPAVVVKYDRVGLSDQFQADIRRIEEKLNIGPKDSIPVTVAHAPSGFRMFEFVLGAGIILFLLMGYGRVAARKLAMKSATKPPNQPFKKDK